MIYLWLLVGYVWNFDRAKFVRNYPLAPGTRSPIVRPCLNLCRLHKYVLEVVEPLMFRCDVWLARRLLVDGSRCIAR